MPRPGRSPLERLQGPTALPVALRDLSPPFATDRRPWDRQDHERDRFMIRSRGHAESMDPLSRRGRGRRRSWLRTAQLNLVGWSALIGVCLLTAAAGVAVAAAARVPLPFGAAFGAARCSSSPFSIAGDGREYKPVSTGVARWSTLPRSPQNWKREEFTRESSLRTWRMGGARACIPMAVTASRERPLLSTPTGTRRRG